MGKFDGVLLISDFDDTMLMTSHAMRTGAPLPEMPPYNLERLQYFMDNGGKFALASGRVWVSFETFLDGVPTNAPCGTGNGAAIIDPATGKTIFAHTLPDSILQVMAELEERFPTFGCELYRADNGADAFRPNDFTRNHAKGSRYEYRVVNSCAETEPPLLKILFEGPHEELSQIETYIKSQSWYDQYEVFFSSATLLELIARGANKGSMARKLAELCGCSMEHTYCIGDQANDLPMLAVAKQAFAPANAIPAVLESGATVLCDCMEGAVGQAIDVLDRIY